MASLLSKIRRSAAMTAFLFASSSTLADVPRLIHYQGKLLTATGDIATGSVSLRLRLYNHATAAAPILFDETHTVALDLGIFSVAIGSSTRGGVSDAALDQPEVYLGITINDGIEMLPRPRVMSGPYAVKANLAEQLVRPDTFAPAVTVAPAGNVGVGTTTPTPSASLDVVSTIGGLLPPRMTTEQRDAIAGPVAGLVIMNTTTTCLEFYTGNRWQPIGCDCTIAPAAPGAISGPSEVCAGQTDVAYGIAAVSGASSYTWTVPAGASVTSGQGTTNVNVTFAGSSGNVQVTATNSCGTGPANSLSVTVSQPPTVANAGPDQLNVSGTSATLAGSVPTSGSGVWTIISGAGGNVVTPSSPTSIFTGQPNTTYVLRWTISNACGASQDEVTIAFAAAPPQRRIFVTSETYNANMGGLAGADSRCQARADAAGLGGTYKAWLSSTTTSAAGRMSQAAVPYVLVNGTVIANNWADLTDGSIQSPLNRTELNTVTQNGAVWTMTTINGSSSSSNLTHTCSDWTTAPAGNQLIHCLGSPFQVNGDWTAGYGGCSHPCSAFWPLFCLEQ